MTLQRELILPLNESVAITEKTSEPATSARGMVECCEFEDLLERAMEILKTRRAGAGSGTV